MACVHGFCYQEAFCIYFHSEQWSHEDENYQEKINRERAVVQQRSMPHVTRVTVKVFLNQLLFSVEDSLKYNKTSTETTLLCFGSFVFSWPIVSSYLFVFFFSDKTTVQWYFIVGPSLAVTVLAFIVLYLRKRRIAGTYTSSNKFFCTLNASSRVSGKRQTCIIVIIKKQPNFILHPFWKAKSDYCLLTLMIIFSSFLGPLESTQ